MSRTPSEQFRLTAEQERILSIENRMKDHSETIENHKIALIRGEAEFKAIITSVSALTEKVEEMRGALKWAGGLVLGSVIIAILGLVLTKGQ